MAHMTNYKNPQSQIKYSVDKIQQINKYFGGDEVLCYICYIQANPNMDPEELKYCLDYIEFIKAQNALKIKIALDSIDEQSNKDGEPVTCPQLIQRDTPELNP